MNCMFLYSIRKKSIFLTKSNPQIACSVNSVSGSVFKKKMGQVFEPYDLHQNWYVDRDTMGLNVSLAKETQMGINI